MTEELTIEPVDGQAIPYLICEILSAGIFKDSMKWCHYFTNMMYFLLKYDVRQGGIYQL